MNRLIVCVGKYAKTPYRIKDIRMDIYCVEELCYYLCEYINLLDDDIMDENLAGWLSGECGLKKLSEQLLDIIRLNGSLAAFVSVILEAAYYLPKEKIREIEEILRENEKLNVYERKKKRADNLLNEKKYYFALDIYHQLLEEIPRSDSRLLARVCYNCGVAYARLFYYDIAMELFERALTFCDDERIKEAFLFCKRAQMPKEKYIEYITDNTRYYEAGLSLEDKLSDYEREYACSEEKKELDMVLDKEHASEAAGYYKGIEGQLAKWEEEFNIMTRLT